jgi:GntR family transcriptional regulator/MocR family aminotransferase
LRRACRRWEASRLAPEVDLWYGQFRTKRLDQAVSAVLSNLVAFHVSLVGRKNLSREIYRQIVQAIRSRRLRPGDRLSPTRELAQSLAVSRMTVTLAYERLASEGLIVSRRGAGTYVSDIAVRPSRETVSRRPADPLQAHPMWQSVKLWAPFERPAKFDFRTGIPDTSAFPYRAWHRSIHRALPSIEATAGAYAHPAGLPILRAMIARHIGFSRAVETSKDNIVITNGTQQALDVLARAMFSPGDTIAVEDPGYQVVVQLFRTLGLNVVGVPVDREGLVVDALPASARAVYVTPSHQYPLAVAMTLSRRQSLLAWAEQNHAMIIEDDYDCEFRFKGHPLEPLQTLDSRGRVVYIGSFSKSMLPTLRLGFLVAPPSLLPALHKTKCVLDWHSPSLIQAAVARFIGDGEFARHVRRMTRIYRERHEMVTKLVAGDFSEHLELLPSTAGLHIAALARKASVGQIEQIYLQAVDRGVAIQLLSASRVAKRVQPGIVLGYGAISTARIKEGLHLLRECFEP